MDGSQGWDIGAALLPLLHPRILGRLEPSKDPYKFHCSVHPKSEHLKGIQRHGRSKQRLQIPAPRAVGP